MEVGLRFRKSQPQFFQIQTNTTTTLFLNKGKIGVASYAGGSFALGKGVTVTGYDECFHDKKAIPCILHHPAVDVKEIRADHIGCGHII